MGDFEDRLLRESVDVVVSNPKYLRHVRAVAPETPQLLYTNATNLYQDLLLDWLAYADAHGLSREEAFYHAAQPTAFRGNSPSSQPVTWFWAVYRGGRPAADLTRAARGDGGRVRFGGPGEPLYLGFPERFRELNVRLVSAAAGGWSPSLEYPTAVSDGGLPSGWAPLTPVEDTTHGLADSGSITFDPPADWKPAALGGAGPLYVVRFRTTADGTAPVAASLLGRDYAGARGTTAGTVPAFDDAADANGDGYLNDAEYARRAPGKDARFLYESRMFTANYGQMRYATRPAGEGFRAWCVAHHVRLLEGSPAAGGLFMDNMDGKPPVRPADVRESLADYAEEWGTALRRIDEAIAPRATLSNVAGGGKRADPLVRQSPFYFEEFVLRPLAHNYIFFDDVADTVDRRAALTDPAPYAVLDASPQGGAADDPRTQLGALASYYLLADPDATFFCIFGGFEPGSAWRRHWFPAVAHDVGRPEGKRSLFATGDDPSKPGFTYHVYQRRYGKALVLFKPLSYKRGVWNVKASTGDDSATRHDLGGQYRPLAADGTLGDPVDTITLRNGEGAILIPGVRKNGPLSDP
jgi:hypothetical protein